MAVYWVQRNKGPPPPTTHPHPHSQKVNGKGRGVIVENKVDGRGVLNTSHQNRCKSAIGQVLKLHCCQTILRKTNAKMVAYAASQPEKNHNN